MAGFWRDPQGHDILINTVTPTAASNGLVIANVVGPVVIKFIHAISTTLNGATASTVQFGITPQGGSIVTISGASASLANAPAGTLISVNGASAATPPDVSTTGVLIEGISNIFHAPTGTVSLVVGVGSTTALWNFQLTYEPLNPAAYVLPAF